MAVPAELRYSEEHLWVRLEGDRFRVGITDFAQSALGEVVYVELPERGVTLAQGDHLGEVESTKSVSELYAPVGGRVVEVNELVVASPSQLNADPYGEGWLCVLEIAADGGAELLLDAAAYERLTAVA